MWMMKTVALEVYSWKYKSTMTNDYEFCPETGTPIRDSGMFLDFRSRGHCTWTHFQCKRQREDQLHRQQRHHALSATSGMSLRIL